MGEMIKVTMPKWGLSMVQGTVSDWVVDEGEELEKGQEIVEIETDKIANVLESPSSGTLKKIVAQPGEVLPVAALIGVITNVGAILFTLILYLAKSIAIPFVKPSIPNFVML